MKKYLEADEYESLRSRIAAGKASMRVSKSVARQFFMRVTNESVKAETGESIPLKKLVIWSGVVAPVVLLFSALWQIVIDFGWAAAIAVPLVGIFWTVIAGFTAEKGGWIESIVALVLGLGIAWLLPSDYGLALALLTISLIIHRISHGLAQHWVERLVGRSFAAYDMLVEHITIRDPDAPADDMKVASGAATTTDDPGRPATDS